MIIYLENNEKLSEYIEIIHRIQTKFMLYNYTFLWSLLFNNLYELCSIRCLNSIYIHLIMFKKKKKIIIIFLLSKNVNQRYDTLDC
jgi:hypothetical protein